MNTSWNAESPSLLPAIVCYADILGFRDMVEGAFRSGEEREFLQRTKRSLSAVYEFVRDYSTSDWDDTLIFDTKVFTDNIVVAYPLRYPSHDLGEPELGTLLIVLAYVQATLAAEGFFLRGAITAGQHYQDQDIAYGKALLEAVDLDKSGKPPRLVVGPSVESLISEHLSWYGDLRSPHHSDLLEDPCDGQLFVNYLRVDWEDFPDVSINYRLLEEHGERVREALRRHHPGTSVWRKYAWLATYHNYACHTFASLYSTEDDNGGDYEVMAIRAEAQRVLDHLVPFDAGSVVQPPRPLDAQRLRQRLLKS